MKKVVPDDPLFATVADHTNLAYICTIFIGHGEESDSEIGNIDNLEGFGGIVLEAFVYIHFRGQCEHDDNRDVFLPYHVPDKSSFQGALTGDEALVVDRNWRSVNVTILQALELDSIVLKWLNMPITVARI